MTGMTMTTATIKIETTMATEIMTARLQQFRGLNSLGSSSAPTASAIPSFGFLFGASILIVVIFLLLLKLRCSRAMVHNTIV